MINARELRIGSIISKDGKTVTVDRIYMASDGLCDVNGYWIGNYSPIKITEDLLLNKMGAKNVRQGEYYFPKMGFYFDGETLMINEKRIKYVHKLQNYYFEITDEELILIL